MATKCVRWMCLVIFLCALKQVEVVRQKTAKRDLIITVTDVKDFKKLLRTRTNILAIFAKNNEAVRPHLDLYADVAHEVKGFGTIALINCEESKKACKKYKVSPISVEIKHYKDGEYSQDYDRKDTVKSMVAFMRNPQGDMPWDEDATAGDVVHVEDRKGFNALLKKKKPTLMFFYAPWCAYCKTLKPEFAVAATELKGEAMLAGIDLDKPDLSPLRMELNITAYPTLSYYEKGEYKHLFGGANNKDGIVSWMRNPEPPKAPEQEKSWAEEESDVVHLDNSTFHDFIDTNPSVLVMFYAPWCGHCKKMKPEFMEAATTLKDEGIEGALAAVDATKERDLAKQYDVTGYPKVLYFKDGEALFPSNDRTANKIVEFMKDPDSYEPPEPEVDWEEQESHVVHLTQETFKAKLRRKKHGLVMFYAPWCGHCKAAKPEYTNAAERFDADNKVIFAALDCTKHQSVCSQQEVTGYPTFKYFNYGTNEQLYVGKRMMNDFVKFMRDPLNPLGEGETVDPELEWAGTKGSEEIYHLTDDTFDDFIAEQDGVLIMFYAPWCGHCKRMKPAYGEAALMMKEDKVPGVLAAMDATAHKETKALYGITGFPTIKFFKDGEFKVDFDRDRTATEIYNFMKTPPIVDPLDIQWSSIPSNVVHLKETNFHEWLESKEHVLVMFYVPWCPHSKAAMPEFDKAADQMIDTPNYYFAAVQCIVTGDLCPEEGVKNYPAYHYYHNGVLGGTYAGSRTARKFVSFFKNPPLPTEEKEEAPTTKDSHDEL